MDLARVAELLRDGTLSTKRLAVQTLSADQPSYTRSDLARFEEVVAVLPNAFPAKPEVIESRGMLGGRKEKWACTFCEEKDNGLDSTRCNKCHRDWQGFRQGDLTVAGAVELLTEKREGLVSLLERAAAE